MKVISKNKPKGTEYNALKKMKKAKRIMKEKEDRRRAENKRINAENRKERRLENEFLSKISEVMILEFSKGKLKVLIEDKIEKRSLVYERRDIDIVSNLSNLKDFKLKLYGEMVELKKLKNFKEIEEDLRFQILNDK